MADAVTCAVTCAHCDVPLPSAVWTLPGVTVLCARCYEAALAEAQALAEFPSEEETHG